MPRRTNKRRRRSPSSSSSSSSSEDEELSYASGGSDASPGESEVEDDSAEQGKVESDSAEQGKVENENKVDPLEKFFSAQKRVDTKEPKLTLSPSSIKYYFSTVLRNGELSKEGREELQEKYYMDPAQFETFRPPRLDDTKLFKLGDKEFLASRAGRLISLHTK